MAKRTDTSVARSAERLQASPLGEDLSFLLARANALSIAGGNAALAEHGLRVRSYSVLAMAAADMRPTQRELAEFLRLDPSQVVALVDELQARGLVRREPDPNDRRANVVAATPDGIACFRAARESVRDASRQMLAGLSTAECDQVRGLLREIAFPRREMGESDGV